jgi:hypothetical protein
MWLLASCLSLKLFFYLPPSLLSKRPTVVLCLPCAYPIFSEFAFTSHAKG